MSADVGCGYIYIEAGNYHLVGGIVGGHLYETLNACDREMKTLNLNSAGGSSYLYDIPTITLGSQRFFWDIHLRNGRCFADLPKTISHLRI